MRKKIEELRNREEGFTLVELLAVIVILGIIVAISIPAIGGVINRAQQDADKQEEALVRDAARLYVTANLESLEKNTGLPAGVTEFGSGAWTKGTIPTNVLYEQGYLEDREGETSGSQKLTGNVLVSRVETVEEKGTVKGSGVYKYTYTYEKPAK